MATICGSREDEGMEIVNHEGKRYVLYYRDYVRPEDLQDGNLPMGRLYPHQWIDDDYLYFSSNIHVSGGGTCFYGFGKNGLYRMDLKSGVVTPILSLRPGVSGYNFEFSPNGRRLVYEVNNIVTLMDLQTGEKILLDYGEGIAGTFNWSPDGKKLAYATCQEKKDIYEIEKSTVQIYDLETGQTEVILEIPEHHLRIEHWDEEGVMKIEDIDFRKHGWDYWYFEWNAGQVSQPTLESHP